MFQMTKLFCNLQLFGSEKFSNMSNQYAITDFCLSLSSSMYKPAADVPAWH